MGYEATFVKSINPIEHRRIGLGIIASLLLSVTFLSPSIFDSFTFSNVYISSSEMNGAGSSQRTNDSTTSSTKSGLENATQGSLMKDNDSSPRQSEKGEDAKDHQSLLGKLVESENGNVTAEHPKSETPEIAGGDSTASMNSSIESTAKDSTLGEIEGEAKEIIGNGTKSDAAALTELKLEQLEAKVDTSPPNITSMINDSKAKEVTSNPTVKTDEKIEDMKPLCDFSNRRADICDMHGDIRIHGKSSSVVSVSSETSPRNESWRIRPYPRKTDLTAMADVRELTVKSSNSHEDDRHPACTVNHSVPAVIFSDTGYSGNFFHAFTDILVPLFLTSRQFGGEVQFLVANYRWWWLHKYSAIIEGLTNYELIDLDNDDRVHCFHHTIVGLFAHDDLKIDTSRSPNGVSMADFTAYLRKVYSLPRASPLAMTGKPPRRKPRLLIVARSGTRRFTNLDAVVKTARKVGFEVVVGEAESNVARFARVVNSCDAMMGVHGAGLTNFVFLPANAVLVQVVPWGRLDWIANTYFKEPCKGMKLRCMEYKIALNESTLSELYPSDHPVLSDPDKYKKLGWDAMREMYLVKQNVKLNVRRFRPVLIKALKLLHEQ